MRQQDAELAKMFKGARWSLMKNPENLNDKQAVQPTGSGGRAERRGAPTRTRRRCGRSSKATSMKRKPRS
jgi:hypothetical protein